MRRANGEWRQKSEESKAIHKDLSSFTEIRMLTAKEKKVAQPLFFWYKF